MTVEWIKIKDQSLAYAAREAGFDLTVYEDYSPDVRLELKNAAIKRAMNNIHETFSDAAGDRDLSDIKKGVYVICLSYPYTIEYEGGESDVIYIGRGNLSGRLKSHFDKSLFKLMRSLIGANFDFYLTEPKSKSDAYFKHIEYLLLDKFKNNVGKFRYPLLNKNAGSEQNISSVGIGWDRPLKRSGKRPIWCIKPTDHFDIEALD